MTVGRPPAGPAPAAAASVWRYGRARSQYAELWQPARATEPLPVAVLLHGGFWKANYGRRLMHPLARDLAGRGWAAWNLEYRRIGLRCGGGWPATFEDVAAGIDAMAAVDAPALDLSRIVAIGHSAGGHLALWAAARPGLPPAAPGARPGVRIGAVASQAGVCDLELAWELGLSRGVVRRFLGAAPSEDPERYALASPAARLPLGVPLLLTHGEDDDIVPATMSTRFHAAARAAGDTAELVVVAGEDHFGHLDPGNALWRAVIEWMS